jgi:DNA repair exonuclease SbcCD ATPase subunit
MAEVKLFEVNLNETINNIKRLEDELKAIKKVYKEAAIGSEEFIKAQSAGKELTAEIKKQNDALKANTNALGGVNSAAKFAEGSYGRLKQQIKENRDLLDKLVIGSSEYEDALKEQSRLSQQRIDIEKQLPSLFQERIKGAIDEANSLKELKEQIKEYTAAVIRGEEGAAEKLAELKDKLEDVKDATETFKGSGVEKLNASMGLLRESFSNLDADKLKTAINGLSASFKAIPIFLIIEGFKLLYENFDTLKESGAFLGETFKVLGAALEGLKNDFIAFSDWLGITNIEAQKLYDTFIKNQDALIKGEERNLDTINFTYDQKIKLLKSEGKTTTEIEIQKQKDVKKSLDNKLDLISKEIAATSKRYENDEKKRQEEVAKLKANYNDALKESISAENEITIIKNEAEKQRIENAIKAAEKQKQIREEADKKEKERQKELLEGVKRNQQEEISLLESKIQERKNLQEKSFAEQEDLIKYQYEVAKYNANGNYEAMYKAQVDFDTAMLELQKNQKEEEERINKEYFEKDLSARKLQQEIIINEEQAFQEVNFEDAINTLETQFEAKQNLLLLQREEELYGLEENSLKYQEIISRYNLQEIELERQKQEEKAKLRQAEVQSVANTMQVIMNLGALLAKDQEKQGAFAKMAALINIAANTGLAISNLTATSFSPASPDNVMTGGLAAYAKLAAGLVTITSNMVQAKQLINSFEEGGYTGEGNPHEVSTNLGSKSYTYHKDEYVVPSRVLNTSKGSALAGQLENMRLGMSNPMPHISGMFDGGFTGRSAGMETSNMLSNQIMMQKFIESMPNPVVRVTDINKTQNSVQRAVNVSSL